MRRQRASRISAALLAILLFAPGSRLPAQEIVYSEDEVKAAFLYHFGTYVEWPTAVPAGEAVTVAVLGDDGVVEQLERFLPGRTIADRPVEARRIESLDELDGAEILMIGRAEAFRLAAHIEAVGQAPTLIVTDSPAGLAAGAMINFRIVDDRVRFEISAAAAQAAGLALSSRLLSAALSVDTVGRNTPAELQFLRTVSVLVTALEHPQPM